MDINIELHRAMSDLDSDKIVQTLNSANSGDVDVNHREFTSGLQTLLMRLCHVSITSDKRQEILNLILERNGNVNIQDSSGRTALSHACIAEKIDVIHALSQMKKCDPNIADYDGNTPLMYAVKSRKPSVVEAFLMDFKDRGIEIDLINKKGLTALEESVAHLDSSVSRILIDLGGANTSVLRQRHSSPSPNRRNVDAVLPGPPPRSPRSRRAHDSQHLNDSMPMAIGNSYGNMSAQNLFQSTSNNDMLKVDTHSSRGSSKASSLEDLPEDELEIDETGDYKTQNHNLSIDYCQNSLSLPDLRDMSKTSVNISSILSHKSSNHGIYNIQVSRSNSNRQFNLPQLIEEDSDSDEGKLTKQGSRKKNKLQRKPSVSLPDLREHKDTNCDNNQTCYVKEGETSYDSYGQKKR